MCILNIHKSTTHPVLHSRRRFIYLLILIYINGQRQHSVPKAPPGIRYECRSGAMRWPDELELWNSLEASRVIRAEYIYIYIYLNPYDK